MDKVNMFYLAKPTFGGWVTGTCHLMHNINQKVVYKIGSRVENKLRDFGYGIKYQNVTPEALTQLPNVCIQVLDRHHYQYFKYFNKPILILHDTIEVDYFKKHPDIIKVLKNCKRIITIRQRITDYLKEVLDIDSEYLYHPFYKYPLPEQKEEKQGSVATSRIDWDKHTDIILQSNALLPKKLTTDIWGAENRLYSFHKLKEFGFDKYYKGPYKKSFEQIGGILSPKKFMVDLTIIKNDGGGTQWNFLEAMHSGCCLILHKKWTENGGDFIHEKNCLTIETPEELAKILKDNPDVTDLVKNAKRIVNRNSKVDYKF
jgi:hypothetical protein